MGEDVVIAFVATVNEAVQGLRAVAESAQAVATEAKRAAEGVASITGPATAAADASARLATADDEAAAAAERLATASKSAGDAAVTTAGKTDEAAASSGRFGKSIGLAVLGMGVAAGVAVKMAGNFQDATTHLVTDAGESAKNLAMVQNGILQVSTATGTSAADITNAMYHVESAGYHGAQGLAVLKIAAEGARVGGADLDTIGKTLTGTLNAYGMTSSNAAKQTGYATTMMNELIATVGAGDMRMQDLAASLGNVAPVAAAAGVSFSQVGGALATMTGQNMSAQQATQDLRHTILSLESPNKVAQKEMAKLGLSASDLSSNLGKRGLAATLAMVADAAHQHAPALGQTYTQAMYKAMGGTTGLTTALMLTGTRMGAFRTNAATVADAAKKGGDQVDNWQRIQGTFNFKLAQAREGAKNAAISFGTALLPVATQLMGVMASLGMWFSQNAWAAALLAGVIGTVLSVAIGGKMISSVREGITAFKELKDIQLVQTAVSKGVAAAQWLVNAAMDANPIVLIIIAIIALVAIFVLLWTHCKWFRDFWKAAWHDIAHGFDVARHEIAHGFDIMRHAVAELGHDVATWFDRIRHAVATAGHDIATWFDRIRHDIAQWADDVRHDVDRVVGWFERLPGRILHGLGNLGQLLWNSGIQIVQGLINGIAAMGSAVGNALLNLLPGPVRKFASWLGLASPSRLFHQFGVNTLQGYIDGINSMAPAVHAALGGVGGQIAAGGLGAGGIGGGPGGGVNVTVPLTLMPGTQGYSDPRFLQILQAAVQEAVLRYNLNNPGNGLALGGGR